MKNKITLLFVLLFFAGYALSRANEELADNSADGTSLEDLLSIPIITASKYEQKMNETPASVTVITKQNIRENGYRTITEILNNEIGFFIADDREYTYIGLRGFMVPGSYNNKILILLDGHKLNGNVFGNCDIDNEYAINLNNVEKIEIIKGSGSAVYGSNAVFAVINIITRTSKQINDFEANLNYGSYNTYSLGLNYGNYFSEDFSISVSGKYGHSDGRNFLFDKFTNDTDFIGESNGNDKLQYYGVYVKGELYKMQFQTLFANHFKNVPTAKYNTLFNSDKLTNLDQRAFISISYPIMNMDNLKMQARLFYDYYYFKGQYPYPKRLDYDYNYGNSAGLEINTKWDLASFYNINAGLHYENYFQIDYKLTNEKYKDLTLSDPYYLLSGYLDNNFQISSNFLVIAGIRYDYYSNVSGKVCPRFGIINYFGNTTLKFLYGNAFRNLSIFESKYFEDGAQSHNPDLKPEFIRTHEIILEQKLFSKLFFSASYYYFKFTDLVNLEEQEDKTLMFVNIPTLKMTGMETKLLFKPSIYTSAFIGYSYNQNVDNKNNYFMSFPMHILNLGLTQQFFSNFTITLNMLNERGRQDYNNNYSGNFYIANLIINYIFPISSNKNIRTNLSLNNIFNEKYYHSIGVDNVYSQMEQPGFNFNFSVNYEL